METGGSNDNLALLRDGKADLAPTHLGSASFSDGRVQIVAPLYYGVVCVLVREESGIEKSAELRGRRISLGPPTLGMRDAARKVLEYEGMDENDVCSPAVVSVSCRFQTPEDWRTKSTCGSGSPK